MGDKSKIEWTDATWNPITGCTPVSAGCENCYAARIICSGRTPAVHGSKEFEKIQFHPSRLDQPLRWKKPRRVFVCSMGDLFHEDVKEEWIDKVIGATRLAPQHTFLLLTKRPERMRSYFVNAGTAMVRANGEAQRMVKPKRFICPEAPSVWPRHNLWLGVTAENQEMADQRIPILLQTPAAKRFVSVEPMLGPVDLEAVPLPDSYLQMVGVTGCLQPLAEKDTEPDDYRYFQRKYLKLNWVIAGGESGPGARPMHPDWARSLRDQCQAAGVPFFFKQWGEWKWDLREYGPDGEPWSQKNEWFRSRVGKKAAGCLLDGREWKEFPT